MRFCVHALDHDDAPDDLVSPELALVDPDLAARARHRLADPADSTRPVRREARLRHGDVAAAEAVVSPPRPTSLTPPRSSPPVVATTVPSCRRLDRPRPDTSEVVAAPARRHPKCSRGCRRPRRRHGRRRRRHRTCRRRDPGRSRGCRRPRGYRRLRGPDAAVRRLDALAAEASEPPPPRRFGQRARRRRGDVRRTGACFPPGRTSARVARDAGRGARGVHGAPLARRPRHGRVFPGRRAGRGTGHQRAVFHDALAPAGVTRPAAFAWAPVPDASAYHVELIGARRASSRRTPPARRSRFPGRGRSKGERTVWRRRNTGGTSGRSSRADVPRRPSCRRGSSLATADRASTLDDALADSRCWVDGGARSDLRKVEV